MKNLFMIMFVTGVVILLAACISPQAAPTVDGADKTAESQNAMGTPTTAGGTQAPPLPPEGTAASTLPGPLSSEVPVTPVDELKPADSDSPASGICTDPPEGETVKMTIRADMPDPRCAKAYPEQQLVLVNETAIPVRARLGSMRVVIHPGEEKQLDKPLGEYLEPGVHFIDVTQPGFAGELWLIEK